MARFPNPNSFGFPQAQPMQYESRADTVSVAQFFNAVYAWMAAGLGLTAVVAWWVSTRPDIMVQVFRGPVLIGLIIAELALVFTISAAVRKINAAAATALFMLYSALNGLTLSAIGRNLWLHSKVPNIDPETAFDASNVQGIEGEQLPTPRSIGFTVSVTP